MVQSTLKILYKKKLQIAISRCEYPLQRLLVVGTRQFSNKIVSELQGLVQDVTFMYITFTYNSTIDTDAEIVLIFTLQNVSMAVAEDCLQRLQLADIFFLLQFSLWFL